MKSWLAGRLRMLADWLEPPRAPTTMMGLLIDAQRRYGDAHEAIPAIMDSISFGDLLTKDITVKVEPESAEQAEKWLTEQYEAIKYMKGEPE